MHSDPTPHLKRVFPVLDWIRNYQRADLSGDLVAGTVVAILLVPQAMAYALLAGLPAQMGLYACILPLILYAAFGSSRTLSVSPVAILSLIVATVIADLNLTSTDQVVTAAIVLALMSGLILLILGIARLGFLANFISHSVVSGFTTAAAIVIAVSQLKALLGLSIPRGGILETLGFVLENLSNTNLVTLVICASAIALLILWPMLLMRLPTAAAFSETLRTALSKSGPLIAVFIGTAVVAYFGLDTTSGVDVVGEIPRGLPPIGMPVGESQGAGLDWALIQTLLPSAALIAFVGYVESVAVAKTLASKRRQKIDSNQELIALGAANIGAGFSGGFPVTGGFSRSVVNFTAGANTPLASIVSAVWILLVIFLLTPFFYYLPVGIPAAAVVVSVVALIDAKAFRKTWAYSKSDFVALLVTFLVVLFYGVEPGIIAGVCVSIGLYMLRTSRPHIAIVGRLGRSEQFRNVQRHQVTTDPTILAVRVDASLYFANTKYLQDFLLSAVSDAKEVKHVVLIMSAVNAVDTSALESLESLIDELQEGGVQVNLAEVKGPVMDQFKASDLFEHLSEGQIFLSTHQAFETLGSDVDAGSDHASSEAAASAASRQPE